MSEPSGKPPPRVLFTKEEFEEWRRQWAAMNRWEREQPPDERTAAWSFAALGALHQWLPESTRAEERDPARHGIKRMHELLGRLNSR